MDLLPASSLLSPLSRVLIHTETQFHLTEPIFSLPVLIYGPDHDFGGNLREEKGREVWGAQEASGKGRGVEVGVARGPFLRCLLTGLSRAALNIMGKAR